MEKRKIKNIQLTIYLFFCFLILFLFTNVLFLIFTTEENYPFLYLGLFFSSSTILILFSNFFSEIFNWINVGFYPGFKKPTTKSQKIEIYFNSIGIPFFIYYYQLLAHAFSWNFLKLNIDYSIITFLPIPTGLAILFLVHRLAEIFNIISNIISFINGVIRSVGFARILYSIALIIYSMIFFVPVYIFLPNVFLEPFTLRNTSLLFLSTTIFLIIGIISSLVLPLTKDESVDKKLFIINTQRFYFLVSVNFNVGLLLYFSPNFNENFVLSFVLGLFYFVMAFEMVLRLIRNRFLISLILQENESN